MKISNQKIREDIEEKIEELEILIEGLKNLENDLHDKDIKEHLMTIRVEYEEELEELENNLEYWNNQD